MRWEKKKSPKTLTSLRGYVESLPSCFMAKRVGNSLGHWGNCTPQAKTKLKTRPMSKAGRSSV